MCGWEAGAVLQVCGCILRVGGWWWWWWRWRVARRRVRQVRAGRVSGGAGRAARAPPAHTTGSVRRARVRGPAAVCAGRRAAAVAATLHVGYGRLRGRAPRLPGRLRAQPRAPGAALGRRALRRHGAVRERAVAAGRAARAGAGVRRAAGYHGVARGGAGRTRGGGRAAVPGVGRRAGGEPVGRRGRGLAPRHAHLLPGAARPGAQRAAPRRAPAQLRVCLQQVIRSSVLLLLCDLRGGAPVYVSM